MVDNIQANTAKQASWDIPYVSEQLKVAANILTSQAQDLFRYAKEHPKETVVNTAGGVGVAYIGMKTLSEAPGAVSKFATQIGFPSLVPDRLLKDVEKPYDLYAQFSDRFNIAANPGISQRKQMQIVRAEREPIILKELATNPNLSTNAQVELINRTKNLESIAAGDDILLSLASRSKLHPTVQNELLAQPSRVQNGLPAKPGMLSKDYNGGLTARLREPVKYFQPGDAERILEHLSANLSLTPKNQLRILDRAPQLALRAEVVGNLAENPSITLRVQQKLLEQATVLGPDILEDIELKMLNAKAAAAHTSSLGQEASVAAKGLRVIGTYGGLVPLIGLPAYSAYEEWKKGGSNFDIATSAGKGFVDGIAPGATSGYSDVIGSGNRTYFDRFLNGLDHATGTAAAIGGAAVGIEALGVVTAPAAIPTAFATGVAVLGNVGVNVIKAGVKVSGYAGSDQDGGYIYEGGAWVGRQGGYAVNWAGRQLSAGVAWVGL